MIYSMKNNSSQNSNSAAFWDRDDELALLRSWQKRRPGLAVIHGRRRLGKTALLRRWLREADGLYVQATEGTPASQRESLALDLQMGMPGFGDVVYPSWRALLDALGRAWPSRSTVLVLDEFPYLARSSPELPSLLQAMLDAPTAERIPLVLCGSSQRMMQGLVLDASAPLYGRAQCVLRLGPLPANVLGSALGVGSNIAAVETYAAFGGVPRYWELMREGRYRSAEDALSDLVFSPHGVLHEEAERVLRDEEAAALEKAVCELVGRGARRPSEIAARLGVKVTTLSKPLRHLCQLHLLERNAPYDLREGRPEVATRRAFYRIADPFLAMWYACVRPYLSGLQVEAPAALQHAREAWGQHVAAMWEGLCREQWHRIGHDGVEWERAGRHWTSRQQTGDEWDVASVSADRRRVFLGECKWLRKVTQAKARSLVADIRSRQLPAAVDPSAVGLGLFLPDTSGLPRSIDRVALLGARRVMEA